MLQLRGLEFAMDAGEFKRRTQQFALRIVRLVESLPDKKVAREIGGQLLRCGMSVGANYRAAGRARSGRDFIAKMTIVEEECDESIYWMELLILAEIVKASQLELLMTEAKEILSMVVSSINTRRKSIAGREP